MAKLKYKIYIDKENPVALVTESPIKKNSLRIPNLFIWFKGRNVTKYHSYFLIYLSSFSSYFFFGLSSTPFWMKILLNVQYFGIDVILSALELDDVYQIRPISYKSTLEMDGFSTSLIYGFTKLICFYQA